MKKPSKIISTRHAFKDSCPEMWKGLRKLYWKFQWIQRAVLAFVIPGCFKFKRSGQYIDDNCLAGFISTKGKKVEWGKQYSKLYFLGLVD